VIVWCFSAVCAWREANTNYSRPLERRLALVSACVAGLVLSLWLINHADGFRAWQQGRNDFLGFYAGARLVGSPNLYDRDAVQAIQLQAVGGVGEIQFGRLPCYALFLKPLTWLPYRTANAVWFVLLAAAFAGFVALWPHATVSHRWLIGCWSLPAVVSFFNGQDDVVLLLWVALAARLQRAEKPAVAGMILALCASKFNLFALVPLVLLGQRRWRMLWGMAFGVCILLALSFAAAGASWPTRYMAVLAHPGMNSSLDHMPNLHSLFGTALGLPLQFAADMVMAVGLFLAARSTSDFEGPVALALVAGLLVGFHAYLADGALLLPALFAFSAEGYARFPARALIMPVPWILLQCPRPLPAVTQLLILALAGAGFCWIWRCHEGNGRHCQSNPGTLML